MSKEKIYTYVIDCKVTEIEGIFIAPESEVEKLKDKELPLGEVIDNVCIDITYDDLKVICEDQEKIQVIKSVLGENITGRKTVLKIVMVKINNS